VGHKKVSKKAKIIVKNFKFNTVVRPTIRVAGT
jgi:hypothetical protein